MTVITYQLVRPSPLEPESREDCVTISGSHGELQVLKKTGQILHWWCPVAAIHPEDQTDYTKESLEAYARILHFDVREYVEWWGELDNTDIVLIGYWWLDDAGFIRYEEPVHEERNNPDRKLLEHHVRKEEPILWLSRDDICEQHQSLVTAPVWNKLVDVMKDHFNDDFRQVVSACLEDALAELGIEPKETEDGEEDDEATDPEAGVPDEGSDTRHQWPNGTLD